MKIEINDSHLSTIIQLRNFLKGTERFGFSLRHVSIGDKYQFIDERVDRFRYHKLKRKDKRTLVKYLRKVTGYRHAQIHRLISRATIGDLKRKTYTRKSPCRIYAPHDIKLLKKTGRLHRRLSTYATKKILEREVSLFHKEKYSTISGVSPAHIHNLRSSRVYQSYWINHTKARHVSIGETGRPENFGKPGSLRVDSVSQRDIYHINAVDEITQREVLVADKLIIYTHKPFGKNKITKTMINLKNLVRVSSYKTLGYRGRIQTVIQLFFRENDQITAQAKTLDIPNEAEFVEDLKKTVNSTNVAYKQFSTKDYTISSYTARKTTIT